MDEMLKRLGWGDVSGGGTQTADEPAGIAYCDIEISLTEASVEVASAIIVELERLGAPKGSKLIFDRMPDAIARSDREAGQVVALDESGAIPFGKHEGLALFLNGTDLPDEVYKNSDSNELFAECRRLMGSDHAYTSYWNGSRETALYFYGPSFERMKEALSVFVDKEPSCEKCRIERIA